MRLLNNTDINFSKYSKPAIMITSIIILAGLISMFFIRGLNLGIDFTGGTLVQVRCENPANTSEIRDVLKEAGLPNAVIQKMGGNKEFLIRIPQSIEVQEAGAKIKQGLARLSDNTFEYLQDQKVGPKIGEELRSAAFWAIISAIVVIGIYISIRFQYKFAIGAVVALIHDVLFTLGIFSILQLEISLSTIAAFLTIVGYSLNDTIVLFDRVRENVKKKRFDKIDKIVNLSINETLSRTIITSFTTLIVVLILIFSKGEVRIFAIALSIGVLVGTYSSIYIAGPVVVTWQNKMMARKK